MKEISSICEIKDGRLEILNRDKFNQAVKVSKNGRYILSLKLVENIRSLEQNNTFFGIAYLYFEHALIEAGIFKDPSKMQIHTWCMVNYLPEDYRERIYEEWKKESGIVNHKTDEVYKEPFRLTSTKMSRSDAMHYYENMQNGYAIDFSTGEENDFIPDPDPKYKRKK
jgi:hypothetical protein